MESLAEDNLLGKREHYELLDIESSYEDSSTADFSEASLDLSPENCPPQFSLHANPFTFNYIRWKTSRKPRK